MSDFEIIASIIYMVFSGTFMFVFYILANAEDKQINAGKTFFIGIVLFFMGWFIFPFIYPFILAVNAFEKNKVTW